MITPTIFNDEIEAAWVAGFLANNGTFVIAGKAVRLTLKSVRSETGTHRVASALGVNVTNGNVLGQPSWGINVTGAKLHAIMVQLWPQLPIERKREYKAKRQEAKRLRGK